MLYLTICLFLLISWGLIKEYINIKKEKERERFIQDLLNRLMSRNFVEYSLYSQKKEDKPEEKKPQIDLSSFEKDWDDEEELNESIL